MEPTIGRIVIYTSNSGRRHAAIIATDPKPGQPDELIVFWFNGTGSYPMTATQGDGAGQWQWPKREEPVLVGLGAGVGVRTEFAVHMLNEDGKARATQIAQVFSNALDRLEHLCGVDGREMARVRDVLEEASFFAKKAMAKRPENQQ